MPAGIIVTIIVVVVFLLLVGVVSTYNALVRLRNQVDEAFATMDVYLKKRWDLVPNLVEVVKAYAKHEVETFSEIVNLRKSSYNRMSQEEKISANNQLTQDLVHLLAIAEAYPELRSNENFLDLNSQLSSIENDIANARKFYNGAVKEMNNKTQVFPSNIVAGMFGFEKLEMFKISDSQKENVKVKF